MGCGCSNSPSGSPEMEVIENKKPVERLPDPTPQPSPVILTRQAAPKPKFSKPKLPKPPEHFTEDFIIVWLDPSIESDMDIQEEKEQLQKLVNVVITYNDPDECLTFINGVKDEKIFLIVSGEIVEEFVPTVQVSQIDSVYCFCSDKKQKLPTSKIPGVHGPYTSTEPLCSQLETDIKATVRNLVKPTVVKTDSEKVLFMYDQLFRAIILTSKEEDMDNMNDLYEFCKKIYKNNTTELNNLTKLEQEYSKDRSIWWYTYECFLYKLLNRTLRLHKYKQVYEWRVYIRHLHEQIIVQQEKVKYKNQPLYRGQVMNIEDFNRIVANKGELAFFSNFLSTSIDRETALEFTRKSFMNLNDQNKVRVLMEIKVDKNNSSPFADIAKQSCYGHEGEWLFSLGSVFRIDGIERLPEDDNIQLIRLTFVNDNDEQLVPLKQYLENVVKDETVCLSFARLLYQLGDWKRSKYFYEKSRKNETVLHRKAAILNNLGLIASKLKYDDDKVLEKYNESLELELEEEDSDHKDLASTYNNIGTLYYKNEDMKLAIENFQLAIRIYNDAQNGNHEIAATLYNNIATVLNHEAKHQEALENNVRCLTIRKQILPPNHPSLAIAYNSIAFTYHCLRKRPQDDGYAEEAHDYAKEAVRYAKKAVDIDNLALPPDHPQTETHQKNLDLFREELLTLVQ